jgi:hypothetical protein
MRCNRNVAGRGEKRSTCRDLAGKNLKELPFLSNRFRWKYTKIVKKRRNSACNKGTQKSESITAGKFVKRMKKY